MRIDLAAKLSCYKRYQQGTHGLVKKGVGGVDRYGASTWQSNTTVTTKRSLNSDTKQEHGNISASKAHRLKQLEVHNRFTLSELDYHK